MAEHLAITVDEVVLFEAVQDDGDTAIEHLGQAGLRESASTWNNVFVNFKCINCKLKKMFGLTGITHSILY